MAEDGFNEIIVGTHLDTGTFDDWQAGLTDRNRGKLVVLKPQSWDWKP